MDIKVLAFWACVFLVLGVLLSAFACAEENLTLNDTVNASQEQAAFDTKGAMDQVSTGAKDIWSKMKALPVEVWIFGTIFFAFMALSQRGAMGAEHNVMKIGMWVVLAAIALWVLLLV